MLRIQDTETASYEIYPNTHQPPWPNDPYDYWGLSREYNVVHTLELVYLTLGVQTAGYSRSSEAAAKWMFKTQPLQWISATIEGQPQVGEVDSFAPWALLAVLPSGPEIMQRMCPPGLGHLAGTDTLHNLLMSQYADAYAKAAERLEG